MLSAEKQSGDRSSVPELLLDLRWSRLLASGIHAFSLWKPTTRAYVSYLWPPMLK